MVEPDDDKKDQADQSETESDFFTNEKVSGYLAHILGSSSLGCMQPPISSASLWREQWQFGFISI